LSLAALLKLWLAPFFWNFFLGGRGKGNQADHLLLLRLHCTPRGAESPRMGHLQSFALPHISTFTSTFLPT
jgi:hypothetical protein